MLLALASLSAMIVALMCRWGTLDHPVNRSSHTQPTPKGGGVGIVAAFALGMAIRPDAQTGAAWLTAAGVFLAAASYADDVRNWPFWLKLAAQILAGAVVLLAGFVPWTIALPGFGTVAPGVLAPALGLGWLMFTTNAVNFMDGLNGLAAGSVAAGCVVLAMASRSWSASWPECLLVAGIAGFLPFNYPAARIFMGDVGSQFLGFVVAALALRHATDSRLALILPASLMPMLLDVAVTLVRRWRAGDRLTQAHRSHFYQIAHRVGMPAWLVSLIYWGMAAAGGLGGAWAKATGDLAAFCLALVPFAAWAGFVVWRSRRAGLGRW